MIRAGNIAAPVASTFVGVITSLQDTLSNLERIADTPLPFAYQAHLRMSIWYVCQPVIMKRFAEAPLTFKGFTCSSFR